MYYKTKPERSNAMDDSNVNYKEKYLELMRAAEKAINILIQAQRDCARRQGAFCSKILIISIYKRGNLV